ncbi:hypothetical protein D3C87_1033030 [compost metagenome]
MPSTTREGFTVQIAPTGSVDDAGNPLTTSQALAFNLWTDMLAGGFQLVEHNGGAGGLREATKIIMRPSLAVDPLWATDKWHVYFEVRGASRAPNPLAPVGGTYIYPQNRGLYFRVGSDTQLATIAGMSSSLYEYPLIPDQFYFLETEQYQLINLDDQNPRISARTPMAYVLTIVERGFVVGLWSQALTEDTRMMGVMCIQRGVGCDGTVSSTGQKPLYMVTNVSATGSGVATGRYGTDGPRNLWFYSIIREADTTQSRPSWQSFTGSQSPGDVNGYKYNTNCISAENEPQGQSLNYFPTRWKTPVTTDTGEYILLFPFGLCTGRFAFSDEIDLIAVSKADAYQHSQSVPVTVYNDARQYTAFNSNNQHMGVVNYDSGIRIFIMTSGTGAE